MFIYYLCGIVEFWDLIFWIIVFINYSFSFICIFFEILFNNIVEIYVVFIRGMFVYWIRKDKVFVFRFGLF